MAPEASSRLRKILLSALFVTLIGWLVPRPLQAALMALVLAVCTRRPALSMSLAALYTGAWLLEVPPLSETVFKYWVAPFVSTWHICLMGFTLSLLGLVSVMTVSGGTSALLSLASRAIQTRRRAKLSTAVAGLCVFFDDYANALVVGPTMRPVTDRFGVSRQKLAYLVDSTAAPVAGLALLSTWVGYEVGLFQDVANELSLAKGGYALLVAALPYRFYCLFALALVFLSSYWERDFPPMHAAERSAHARGTSNAPTLTPPVGDSKRWFNAALPLVVLLTLVPVGLVVDGGIAEILGHDASRFWDWTAYRQALMASENNVQVLLLAALGAVAVAFALPWASRHSTLPVLARAFGQGMRAGAPPLLILLSAWALATACKDLGTGDYLVQRLGDNLTPQWIPLVGFVLSAVVALCTGTSFGTMAIVIPAIAPLAHAVSGGEALLLVTLASVLDGAIFGDHCSPLSDTTVMSSLAADCDHMAHVATQLPYAFCSMISAAVCGYALVAQGGALWLAYASGLLLQVGTLWVLGRPLPVFRRSFG